MQTLSGCDVRRDSKMCKNLNTVISVLFIAHITAALSWVKHLGMEFLAFFSQYKRTDSLHVKTFIINDVKDSKRFAILSQMVAKRYQVAPLLLRVSHLGDNDWVWVKMIIDAVLHCSSIRSAILFSKSKLYGTRYLVLLKQQIPTARCFPLRRLVCDRTAHKYLRKIFLSWTDKTLSIC